MYGTGFIPTVLNRGMNVGAIGEELETLCTDFGKERGGVTGLLQSKDQFLVTAGRDRIVRYWDLRNPTKSFRISSTDDKTKYRYKAYLDKKYDEVVFDELVEYSKDETSNFQAETSGSADLYNKKTSQIIVPKSMKTKNKAVHRDVITDLKAIEFPNKMLLTSGRNGIVKVWI